MSAELVRRARSREAEGPDCTISEHEADEHGDVGFIVIAGKGGSMLIEYVLDEHEEMKRWTAVRTLSTVDDGGAL